MLPRRLSTGAAYEPRGAMQHRITLLKPQPDSARNNEGEYPSPTDFADSWASIVLLQGRELDKTQQIVAEVTHKIIIPYISGIDSGMLVQFGTRMFVIQAVQDIDERQFQLNLLCVERNEGRDGEQ